MISFNKSIVSNLVDKKYGLSNKGLYLYPAIKEFVDEKYLDDVEIPEKFEEFREIEYSDNPILQIIQKDLIDDFILYASTNKFDLNEEIDEIIMMFYYTASNININLFWYKH